MNKNNNIDAIQNLNNVNADGFRNTSKSGEYISSAIQADTLFTFTTKVKYLCDYIKWGYIPARYCVEDVSYLKLDFEKIGMPMKCFCDIRLHELKFHLDCYGYYGIAFSKEWGMRNKLQPVHYINTDSYIREDYSFAFSEMMEMQKKHIHSACNNYILELLLYMKPYQGNFMYRKTQEYKPKCFTEESEWRFVPNFNGEDYKTFLLNSNDFNVEYMKGLNDCLASDKKYALRYDYDEIKYIIVENVNDFNTIVNCIVGLNLEENMRNSLISKIIIWSESKGDF